MNLPGPLRSFANLAFIQTLFFNLYIIFNFVSRDISYIFLLITLILCISNYKELYKAINDRLSLVIVVLTFSLWIFVSGTFHNSEASELDNYLRFLVLLPLLSINYKDSFLNITLIISSVLALSHFSIFFTFEEFSTRYKGTSSYPITYASVLLLLSIICFYRSLSEKNITVKRLLILSAITNTLISSFTQSLGPILAFVICLLIFSIINGRVKSLIFTLILVSVTVSLSPQLSDKTKSLRNVDIYNVMNNESRTIRERLGYLHYGLSKFTSTYLIGYGPQNIEQDMQTFFETKNIKYTRAQDHLHNEFIDISVKFGLVALILLLIIYYLMYKNTQKHKLLVLFLIIYIMGTQLTQSQISHSQIITLFISLIYTFINIREKVR